MDYRSIKSITEKAIENNNGILYLQPAWVARASLPPGRRLGLREEDYNVGERGFICARWLGSETKADNAIGPIDEGLSYLDVPGHDILLRDAIGTCAETIMGNRYAATHKDLGRLAKLFDFGCRLYYHVHQTEKDAKKVGRKPKEESYFFLEDVELGPHPETFFGVHPYIVEQDLQIRTLLPYLEDWNSDLILKHARAYLNVPGEGFHLPAGGLHAPGSTLTLEIQEPSDVQAVLQAKLEGRLLPKEALFKDVSKEDRERYGEKAVLNQVDWTLCGDPYFYENRHIEPITVEETKQESGCELWISYNTKKFSAKKLTVKAMGSFTSRDDGIYTAFIWKGKGRIDGHEIAGKTFGIDEVLVCHAKATESIVIENTGSTDLVMFKIFGPDINVCVPTLKAYSPRHRE